MKKIILITIIITIGLYANYAKSLIEPCQTAIKSKKDFFHQEQTDTLTVFGNCKMCKKRIEKSILGRSGVTAAEWDVKTKLLTVTYHPFDTSLDDIQKMIIESGHDTRKYKTDNKTYNKLPECCKYHLN